MSDSTSCQYGCVGESLSFRCVLETLHTIAPRQCTAVLFGESGTGKEMAARLIHTLSHRASGPFIPVDCSNLSGELLASELFGHVRGAFTGADRDTLGFFRAADGGTIFLDEIGEMEAPVLARLLRVLQESTVTPVGASIAHPINVRVICATHRDLEAMVAEGTFRSDLYYRLNVFAIKIPPLRERPDDIFDLARHFVAKYSKEYHLKRRISVSSLKALQRYPFPGNVRELMNVINKAVVISEQEVLDHSIEHFLNETIPHTSGNAPAPVMDQSSLNGTLLAVEKEMLARALKRCRTTYELAQALGISQSTAFRKLKRHKLATKIQK